MANENIQKSALDEGIAFMDKCLDDMLADLRKEAHNAIDMDDWNKAEEIIAQTKNDIVAIEGLKTKFAEFKAEAAKLGSSNAGKTEEARDAAPEPAEQPKSAEAAKPAEQPKPVEAPKPAAPKPTEQPKPAEAPKPAAPKPSEQPKPTEAPKPAEPKPSEQPKPTEAPKPAAPKPAEQPKPAEAPKPTAPKPAEQPKPVEASKPVEQPKPAPAAKPAAPKPAPAKPEINMDVLDMDMSDFEPAPKPKNPIIEACEDLITKFPFSMRLIYSNDKIGRFFTTDDVIAENDMSKPVQLTNGLWVETNIPEERVQAFIRGITRYCEESVNM